MSLSRRSRAGASAATSHPVFDNGDAAPHQRKQDTSVQI